MIFPLENTNFNQKFLTYDVGNVKQNCDIMFDNVSVITKSDVADFSPLAINEGLHENTTEFIETLLEKLINAEQACYKSSVFLNLEQRTRLTMLNQVDILSI